MSNRRTGEIPYQDFSKIAESIYKKRRSRGYLSPSDLFTDPSFPPDWSSLTYVYSGDDKYEKTIFKRPMEIAKSGDVTSPVLVGVGGVCNEDFPWKTWKQRGWFHGAVNVVSLGLKLMERIIPGYRNFEQNFDSKYIGAFHFNLWRFGEWVDVVTDDFLPILNDTYFFCSAFGSPPEFWAPLIEKAYAKCKKTFQAVEYGNILDALTDLTGAVCEFYTPDVNPPENLFHVLYKSNINRSMMICWRNNKRLTASAFDFDEYQRESFEVCDDSKRYLHLITAVTKFPMTDGRRIDMVRIKCPFPKEPKWIGRFSELDSKSWNTINSDFKENFRPLSRKEDDEYWLTMEDFRCNFGGIFVISSTEPFTTDGLRLERKYRQENGFCVRPNETVSDPSDSSKSGMSRERYTIDTKQQEPNLKAVPSTCFGYRNKSKNFTNISHLAVREARHSSKVDNSKNELAVDRPESLIVKDNASKGLHSVTKHASPLNNDYHCLEISSKTEMDASIKTDPPRRRLNSENTRFHHSKFKMNFRHLKSSNSMSKKTVRKDLNTNETLPRNEDVNSNRKDLKSRDETLPISSCVATVTKNGAMQCKDGQVRVKGRMAGPLTNIVQDQDSVFSSSEISLHFQSGQTGDDAQRPRSAPVPGAPRNNSEGSIGSLTQSHFLATKTDFFKCQGRWRILFEHKDCWTRDRQGVSRADMDAHSRSPRILFSITRTNDIVDPNLTPRMNGKRHVVISLLQDYRHGPSTANSLLLPIGFCLYKAKNIDRDDKRHLSKLPMIGELDGQAEVREVNARFDLDPGGYILVPYCLADSHEGEFLIRILAEWDPPGGRAGW
ncbi:hypothetical protein SNE40_021953 [Patella caerulea]|uniref:Calpain catalytic domain-containing protein n=1 Tax=Patella caerulea TaxID=87958 RepID=A0AAN8GC92_PATCE